MHQSDFERLSLHHKLAEIFENGEEINLRHFEGFAIKLFQLSDFFCEIWYSSEANKIYDIQIVDTNKIVALYPINLDFNNLING